MTCVAPDVISSYQKLLPVLDNLYDAESEKEVGESVWTAFSEFGSVATVAVNSGIQITSGDVIGGSLNLAKAGADAMSLAGDRYEREIEVLKKINLQEKSFGFEIETTMKISKLSLRIFEVGVSYLGRTKEEGKKIKKDINELFRIIYRLTKLGNSL